MHRIFLFILAVGVLSCTTPKEPPVFKRVTNIKVSKVEGKKAFLNADAYFFNPNDVSMKLREVAVDVTIDGKNVGNINQSLKTEVPANADFKVPVGATFRLDDVGTLNSLLGMLGGKKLKVHYTGFIKVTIHGVPLKVPVDYEGQFKL